MENLMRGMYSGLDVMTGITAMPIARLQISGWIICGLKKDPWQVENANRLQRFYCEEQREHWDGVFLIDGTRLEEKALHPTAIIAVNAQASLAADGKYAVECVKRFWETPLRTGDRRYYDNFLYLFAMLALSGNYRIWK